MSDGALLFSFGNESEASQDGKPSSQSSASRPAATESSRDRSGGNAVRSQEEPPGEPSGQHGGGAAEDMSADVAPIHHPESEPPSDQNSSPQSEFCGGLSQAQLDELPITGLIQVARARALKVASGMGKEELIRFLISTAMLQGTPSRFGSMSRDALLAENDVKLGLLCQARNLEGYENMNGENLVDFMLSNNGFPGAATVKVFGDFSLFELDELDKQTLIELCNAVNLTMSVFPRKDDLIDLMINHQVSKNETEQICDCDTEVFGNLTKRNLKAFTAENLYVLCRARNLDCLDLHQYLTKKAAIDIMIEAEQGGSGSHSPLLQPPSDAVFGLLSKADLEESSARYLGWANICGARNLEVDEDLSKEELFDFMVTHGKAEYKAPRQPIRYGIYSRQYLRRQWDTTGVGRLIRARGLKIPPHMKEYRGDCGKGDDRDEEREKTVGFMIASVNPESSSSSNSSSAEASSGTSIVGSGTSSCSSSSSASGRAAAQWADLRPASDIKGSQEGVASLPAASKAALPQVEDTTVASNKALSREDLQAMTVLQLFEFCKSKEVKAPQRLRKKELIDFILERL